MGRTIKASEVKRGMEIQVRMKVDSILEHPGWVETFQEDGRNIGFSEDMEFEVLREPRPDEPAPGSVVRTSCGDMFCRVENRGILWQRVNGTGLSWTWREILASADGDPEILFNSEGR